MSSLRDRPIDQVPTVVLDFETTGLRPDRGDRVIEVGMVRVPSMQAPTSEEISFSALVYPDREIPADATHIHGLTNEAVADAPPFVEILPRIEELLEGAVLVAQNAPFDLGFLAAERSRLGLDATTVSPVVCTLALARHIFALPRCNLAALAHRTGVPQPTAHRALADVRTTLGVYRAFVCDLSQRETPTVGAVLDRVAERQVGGGAKALVLEALTAARDSGEPVTIDYTARQGTGALTTRRAITVRGLRPPYVEAWCHLRDQDRIFRLDRIQRVVGITT